MLLKSTIRRKKERNLSMYQLTWCSHNVIRDSLTPTHKTKQQSKTAKQNSKATANPCNTGADISSFILSATSTFSAFYDPTLTHTPTHTHPPIIVRACIGLGLPYMQLLWANFVPRLSAGQITK